MVNKNILKSSKHSVVEQNISMYDNVYEQMIMQDFPEEEDYASMEPREENYISSLVASEHKTEDNNGEVRTGHSTLSITSALDKEVQEEQENKAVEQEALADDDLVKEPVNVELFGTAIYGKNIEQRKNGILYNINIGSEEKPNYVAYPLLDGVLTSIKRYVDNLKLVPSFYEITYYSYVTKQELVFTGSLKEIAKELENEADYVRGANDIQSVLASFKNKSKSNNGFRESYYSLNGYYIHNGHYISNNKHHNVYVKYSEDELKEALKGKVELLNKYLGDLHDKFTPVFKHILLSPYYYLFRQLNIQSPIKFIYLDGKGQVGKTTTLKSFLTLYYLNPVEECIDKPKAIRRIVENRQCTTMVLVDEFDILTNKSNVGDTMHYLKTARFSKVLGNVSDLNNQKKTVNYHNFSYLMGTSNDPSKFKEGLTRVLLNYEFLEGLTQEQKSYLEDTYTDIDLGIIGYVFNLEMELLYNNTHFKGVFSTNNKVNNTINQLLHNIEEKYDVKFNESLFKVNPYTENDNSGLSHDAPNTAWTKLVLACKKSLRRDGFSGDNVPMIVDGVLDFLKTKTTQYKSIKFIGDYILINEKDFTKFINFYSEEVINSTEFLNEVFEEGDILYNETTEFDYGFEKVRVFNFDKQTNLRVEGARFGVTKHILFNKKGILKMLCNI